MPLHFLPSPSGPFVVSYLEVLTVGEATESVQARIIYPTDQPQNELQSCDEKSGVRWLIEDERVFSYISNLFGTPLWLTRKVFSHALSDVYVPCLPNQRLSCQKQFPVIVFSHGLSGSRAEQMVMLMELASWGFIVVSLDHRDGSSMAAVQASAESEIEPIHFTVKPGCIKHPKHIRNFKELDELRSYQLDHRILEVKAARRFCDLLNDGTVDENSLVWPQPKDLLKMFKGRLNMGSVFLMGFSFGGATALISLAGDHGEHYRGGFVLDGWMFPLKNRTDVLKNVRVPCFFLNFEQIWVPEMHKVLRFAIKDDGTDQVWLVKNSQHDQFIDLQEVLNAKPFSRYCLAPVMLGSAQVETKAVKELASALILKRLFEQMGEEVPVRFEQVIRDNESFLVRGIDEVEQMAKPSERSLCTIL